jgi:hypothetical protein
MTEAARVLRRGGLLWVKGKDEIENGRQCWAHVELHLIAQELGMVAVDKFYLTTGMRMGRCGSPRQHEPASLRLRMV